LKHIELSSLEAHIALIAAPYMIFISALDIFIVKLNIASAAYVYAVTISL